MVRFTVTGLSAKNKGHGLSVPPLDALQFRLKQGCVEFNSKQPCLCVLYFFFFTNIFNNIITASAPVALFSGANCFAPLPSIMPSLFMAVTAHAGISLSSAKLVVTVAWMDSPSALEIMAAIQSVHAQQSHLNKRWTISPIGRLRVICTTSEPTRRCPFCL